MDQPLAQAAETPAPGTPSIEDAQNDALAQMMGLKPVAVETPAAEAEAPTETTTTEVAEAEEPKQEDPEAVAEAAALAAEQAEEAANKAAEAKGEPAKVPKRFRPAGTDEDKKIANLANQMVRDLGIPLVEAMDRVTGRQQPAKVTETQEPVKTEPETPQTPPEVAALETTVTDLEVQLEKAEEDGDGLSTAETRKLNRELIKANANLAATRVRAEIQAQQNAQEAARQKAEQEAGQRSLEAKQAEWNSELAAVKQDYPDMADEGSFLFLTAQRLTNQAKADSNHPMHADLHKPNAPRLFTEAAAKAIKAPLVVAKPAAAQPVKTVVKPPAPASGFRSTTPAPPALTPQEIVAKATEDALSVLGGARSPQTVKRTTSVVIG